MSLFRKATPTGTVDTLVETVADMERKLADAEARAHLVRVDLKAEAAQRLIDGTLRDGQEQLARAEQVVADIRLALESARAQLHREQQSLADDSLAAKWAVAEAALAERTVSIAHVEQLTRQLADAFLAASTLTTKAIASLPVPCRLPDQFGDVGVRAQMENLLGRLTRGALGRPMIADPVYFDRQPTITEHARGDANQILAQRNRRSKPTTTNGEAA